jgi:hypothetical protein
VTIEIIHLAPAEIAADRPFTDPAHSADDMRVLDVMRARLVHVLRENMSCPPGTTFHLTEDCGHQHRIVVLNREAILSAPILFAVGFFGQRRPQADTGLMDGVDTELIDEMHSYPNMFSYSSLERPDGNWANLVLLSSAPGSRHWRESARHGHAAYQIAPRYYLSIRLHNAALPDGLLGPGPRLNRTTYYDFQHDAWWQAVRAVGASA